MRKISGNKMLNALNSNEASGRRLRANWNTRENWQLMFVR